MTASEREEFPEFFIERETFLEPTEEIRICRDDKDDKSLVKEHLLTSMHILRIMETIRRGTNQEMADKMVTLSRKDIHKGSS